MVIKRHPEPLLWLLFSAGGVLSAMLMPILLLLLGIAVPLALDGRRRHTNGSAAILSNPLTRLALLALCVLSLFHWAHRFRHTLYDGLQIKHLNEVIALIWYGLAIAGSVVAAYLLWQTPPPT